MSPLPLIIACCLAGLAALLLGLVRLGPAWTAALRAGGGLAAIGLAQLALAWPPSAPNGLASWLPWIAIAAAPLAALWAGFWAAERRICSLPFLAALVFAGCAVAFWRLHWWERHPGATLALSAALSAFVSLAVLLAPRLGGLERLGALLVAAIAGSIAIALNGSASLAMLAAPLCGLAVGAQLAAWLRRGDERIPASEVAILVPLAWLLLSAWLLNEPPFPPGAAIAILLIPFAARLRRAHGLAQRPVAGPIAALMLAAGLAAGACGLVLACGQPAPMDAGPW